MTARLRPSARLGVAVALLLFACTYLYGAAGFSFGGWSSPKAGFFPTIVGAIGVGLGVANLAATLLREGPRPDFGAAPRRALLVTAALAAYVLALPHAGFLASTAGALFLLTKAFGSKGWLLPLAFASGTAVAIYLLFQHLLVLQLPGSG